MTDKIDYVEKADECFKRVEDYLESKTKIKEDFLSYAKDLLEIQRERQFEQRGFSSWEEFMQSEKFGSKSKICQHTSVYEKYIEQLGFLPDEIRPIGIAKLEKIISHANKIEDGQGSPLTRSQYEKYLAVAECSKANLERELERIDEEEDEIELTPKEEREFSRVMSIRKVKNQDQAKDEIERLSKIMKSSPVAERRKMAKILARNHKIAELVKEREGYVCQICKTPAFARKRGGLFAEAHHIYELAVTRIDDPQQMQCLCPTCHRVVHFGSEVARIERQNLAKPQS